jgi:SAM-dependent methyltransferase
LVHVGLLPDREKSHVLIAGIGNDMTPIGMYDAGWRTMTAYDYSAAGVERATHLFAEFDHMDNRNEDGTMIHNTSRNVNIQLADARDLSEFLADGSIDATLDKGTLDAIYITSKDEAFLAAIKELERVTAPGGVVVSLSRVIYPDDLLGAFEASGCWDTIHDGTLAFAEEGGASIDLGAELYSFRRRRRSKE